MPTGKVPFTSAIAWRSTLSRLVEIELGREPYEACSDAERRKLLASMRRSRVSYEINIRSLRKLAKKPAPDLTRVELRKYRRQLREAVHLYQVAHAVVQPTRTERLKTFRAVKTAANRLLRARESPIWANRLAQALVAAKDDQGALQMLRTVIMRKLPARRAQIEQLRGELEARWNLRDMKKCAEWRATRFATKWIPTVRVLAEIDPGELAPKGRAWSDPALPALVFGLAEAWQRVTGYSLRTAPDDQHLFGEWVLQVVKLAGLRFPPKWSVWTVLESPVFKK